MLDFIIYGMIAIVLLSLYYAYLKRDRMISDKYPITAPSGSEYRVQIGYSGTTGKYFCNILKKRDKFMPGMEWKCVESEIISHFFSSGNYDLSKIVSGIILAYERKQRRSYAQQQQNEQELITKELEAFEAWDGKVKEEPEDFSI
ncbi:hypothetical protein ACFFK0_01130 [Paenibacillus chartarius]|uniref:Uncharacterized protein n=1 Tax=Paenibacillus chartarius TaxID=747481 RepID=A0ABV6DEJ0_9BACL